jgi:hypothetical protein
MTRPTLVGDLPPITATMARELAVAERVCVRPLIRRVLDRDTDSDTTVAISCGSIRESQCPPCAHKARVLRMQQCAEGWHRDHEPETPIEQDDQGQDLDDQGQDEEDRSTEDRRVRSTRRRQDAPDLPRVAQEARTVGQTFTAPDGTTYRPSMFLTLTLPSYGPIVPGTGAPAAPGFYDYRRAALDALHFPKLVDRFWQNLRRSAGYRVQYFAAVEPQKRLAPHLHAAIRGAIARATLRQVVRATYVQVWWPPHDQPVYTDPDSYPAWDGSDYVDEQTGVILPTWDEALDQLDSDPDARPAHVMRFGTQADMRGIIAPSADADRAVRYLVKYLTKSLAETYADPDADNRALEAHIDRLHQEIRFLPCSPQCANWLRYGIQPSNPGPGMRPGWCPSKAHDRENLGLGGRRVLVSRQWSGKTLGEHRADRASVVREALNEAGIVAPEVERLAADVLSSDGKPRFVWTDSKPDPLLYTRIILASIAERQRWKAQYEAAKAARVPVDSCSATVGPAP